MALKFEICNLFKLQSVRYFTISEQIFLQLFRLFERECTIQFKPENVKKITKAS